jgi:hypothetical protein
MPDYNPKTGEGRQGTAFAFSHGDEKWPDGCNMNGKYFVMVRWQPVTNPMTHLSHIANFFDQLRAKVMVGKRRFTLLLDPVGSLAKPKATFRTEARAVAARTHQGRPGCDQEGVSGVCPLTQDRAGDCGT